MGHLRSLVFSPYTEQTKRYFLIMRTCRGISDTAAHALDSSPGAGRIQEQLFNWVHQCQAIVFGVFLPTKIYSFFFTTNSPIDYQPTDATDLLQPQFVGKKRLLTCMIGSRHDASCSIPAAFRFTPSGIRAACILPVSPS